MTLSITKHFLFLAGLGAALSICACDSAVKGSPTATSQPAKAAAIADAPLADYQKQLLDLAYETATAIPVNPHIKDRSKAQEDVVIACLEMGQPSQALRYIDGIEDWRRGMCDADMAYYFARHGRADLVDEYIKRAEALAEKAEDWRKDTIKVRIAQTHAALGQYKEAEQYEQGAVEFETGKVAQTKAKTSDKLSFEDQMKSIDALIAPGNFDILNNALEACAQLFDHFYAEPEKRDQAEAKIKKSWAKIPAFVRLSLLAEMGGFALDHKDSAKAIALANEAQQLLDGNQWPLEERIPMASKIIALRARAGDAQKAHAAADALRAQYEADGKKIVNIWRAGALRPLAEAYEAMNSKADALAIYKKAIEEGVENPNSRPRAEDLAATCCSMALHGVQPDAELNARIHQIREKLAPPW